MFRDEDGCIYDMNVSYDARTLLFSYRPKGQPYWHIWRIGTDGGGLRQLTRGPYYDVAPLPLPDGGIMFVSTRRCGYTVCQPGPASNLHRMSADGGDIRCVSMNTLSDFSPQMLPDGRVLFTRWEYVDRDLTFRQSLWTQNPDGTGYQLYFGNTIREVATFWQARPLPGRSDQVVATFAPHHGWPHGAIGLIDTRFGLEGPRGTGYRWITARRQPHRRHRTRVVLARPVSAEREALPGRLWRRRAQGVPHLPAGRRRPALRRSPGRANGLLQPVGPAGGEPAACYRGGIGCAGTIGFPPPAERPSATARRRAAAGRYGTFVLQDACYGLTGLSRDRVKYLRIMEQVRKSEDLASRAYDQSPVMGYGTYYAKRCWGTVELEADGSAHFRALALREVYFQLLDAEGREVHRMTSAAQVMPGETVGCVGCHEPRQSAPPVATAVPHGPAGRPGRGLSREPAAPSRRNTAQTASSISPPSSSPCWTATAPAATRARPRRRHDLSGDKTAPASAWPTTTSSAEPLLSAAQHGYRAKCCPASRPRASRWCTSSGCCGRPRRQPAAVDRQLRQPAARSTWRAKHLSPRFRRPTGSGCTCGSTPRTLLRHVRPQPAQSRPRDLWTDAATGAESAWYAKDYLGVYSRRCQSCHGPAGNPNDQASMWHARPAWIELHHPRPQPRPDRSPGQEPRQRRQGRRGRGRPRHHQCDSRGDPLK